MRPIQVCIISNPEGKALNVRLEYPCVTGDEGFAFIEAFQKKCGVTPKRDPEADRRVREVIERQEREAKARK